MKPRALFVMDDGFFPFLFGEEELARLRRLVSLIGPPVDARKLLAGEQRDAEVDLIISSWGMPELNDAILASMPRLRAVFHAAGTIKSIATEASWERGIRISSAAIENAKPTAEFTFAQIILSLKRAWTSILKLREDGEYVQHHPSIRGCFGSTVGLLSLGNVGRLVAERLATLDVRVIAYDPIVSPGELEGLDVQLRPLEDVFATSDVVSCHMPLSPQTAGILGHELFTRMKQGATFINTARGALVNEVELVAVLRARPDLFAVLDVMESEPPRRGCALLELPNVVVTPHIAGSLGPECRRLGRMMVDEVERYLAGRPLVGEVRREELELIA